MHERKLRTWLGVLALAAATSASHAAQHEKEEYVVGVASGQTGYLAPYDQPSIRGFRLGVEDINAAGGIAGKWKIKLMVRDTRSDPAQTALVTQELIDAGAQLLVVPCDADPAIAAGQIAQEAEVPAFSTCASTPTMTLAVGEYMFGNYPADNVQAAVLANYGQRQGYERAYVLKSPDTAYTLKLPEYFAEAFENKGGEVLAQGTYTMGQQDFSAEVTKIKNLEPSPDVIMTSAYEPDFPAFIKQLRAAGVETPTLESDGIDSPTTFELGSVANGVVFTTAGHPTPGSRLEAFYERYEQEFGEPPDTVYIANGYDLAKVIEAAVEKAGTTDPRAVRDAIMQLENVQGVTGEITYKGTQRMPLRAVALIRVKDGEREFIGTFTPAPEDIPKP